MTFDEYRALPGINATSIKSGYGLSMLAMRHAMTVKESKDTPAFRMGRLVHCVVLEPTRFFQSVALFDGDKVKDKKAWAEFKACHDPEWIVSHDELADLTAIYDAVLANCDARKIINATEHEVSLAWTDDDYGRGKARLDGYSVAAGILEIKTTRQIARHMFAKQFVALGYDLQVGWYAEGAIKEYKLGDIPAVTIISVQPEAPYDIAVYSVPRCVVELGRKNARKTAMAYRLAEKDNRFPGVSEGVQELVMPVWYGQDDICAEFLNTEGVTDE